ncbi:hypothetical protein P9112_003942 [Eukaryota sp. TZLM1-RC]
MKLTVLLLCLSLAIVINAKCVGQSPYFGTQMRCFCDMQKYANNHGSPPDAKVYYSPQSIRVSPGSCRVCSIYFNGIDEMEEHIVTSDDGTNGDITNGKIVFPVNQCLTRSSHFLSYGDCVKWANTKTHVFTNSNWNIRYTAKHRASPAYCNVCGPTDPCNGKI